MDPTTCYAELLEALENHQIGEAFQRAEDLSDWLKKGGFLPKDTTLADVKETIANAYNLLPKLYELTNAVYETVKEIRGQGIEETDVRLQIKNDGWQLHTGDSSYDQDHRGDWGASSVSRENTKGDCTGIARDLLNQIKG